MFSRKHLQEEPLLGPTNIRQNPNKGFSFVKSIVFLFCIFMVFFWLSTLFVVVEINSNVVTINTKKIIHTLNNKFLSVSLDSSLIYRNWIPRLKKIINLTKPLSPAYLRIGGRMADFLIFHDKQDLVKDHINKNEFFETDLKNFTMSVNQWIEINNFAKITNLELIFDLNLMLRTNDNKWNFSNAKSLVDFNEKIGFVPNYQLGNEPNSLEHIFHLPVPSAKQLGEDYKQLRKLLNDTVQQRNSLILGPEVTRPREYGIDPVNYLDEFLEVAVPSKAIDVITWHQYYLNGRTAQLKDFLDHRIMDTLTLQIEQVHLVVNKYNSSLPIWISETADAYGGGAAGLSDSFVSAFLWLDKLGLSALHGIQVVVRQSLFSSTPYSLINQEYKPNPSWWISVLYKRLVGTYVFGVHSLTRENTRVYAHCTPPTQLTVYALNPQPHGTTIILRGFETTTLTGNDILVDEYIIVSQDGISSSRMVLNDIPLELGLDGSIPALSPRVIVLKEGGPLHIPPFSIAFWVFRDLKSDACKKAFS